MFYTIMTLRSFGNETSIDLNKNGNKYQVFFCERIDEVPFITKHEDYKTLDEALRRFQIGSELVAKGLGDANYKIEKIFG